MKTIGDESSYMLHFPDKHESRMKILSRGKMFISCFYFFTCIDVSWVSANLQTTFLHCFVYKKKIKELSRCTHVSRTSYVHIHFYSAAVKLDIGMQSILIQIRNGFHFIFLLYTYISLYNF